MTRIQKTAQKSLADTPVFWIFEVEPGSGFDLLDPGDGSAERRWHHR